MPTLLTNSSTPTTSTVYTVPPGVSVLTLDLTGPFQGSLVVEGRTGALWQPLTLQPYPQSVGVALLASLTDVAPGTTSYRVTVADSEALRVRVVSVTSGTVSAAVSVRSVTGVAMAADIPVNFPQGSALSDPIRLDGYRMAAFVAPIGFEGTVLSFVSCANDGSVEGDVIDDETGTAVQASVASGKVTVFFNVAGAIGVLTLLRIRAGTAASPVPQTVARTATLRMKG